MLIGDTESDEVDRMDEHKSLLASHNVEILLVSPREMDCVIERVFHLSSRMSVPLDLEAYVSAGADHLSQSQSSSIESVPLATPQITPAKARNERKPDVVMNKAADNSDVEPISGDVSLPTWNASH
jgi:hypothetical protein